MLGEALHVQRHIGLLHVEADWQRSVIETEHVENLIRDWVEQALEL